MQFVFVHGVATRSTPAYLAEIERRNEFLKRAAFPNVPINIQNSAWGDLVQDPAWGGASLPKNGAKVEAFSLAQALGLTPPASGESRTLPELARASLEAAVDALIAAMLEAAEDEKRPLTTDEMRLFLGATEYLKSQPNASWVTPQMTDEGFAQELLKKISTGAVSFGLAGMLKDAAGKVVNRARNLAAKGLTGAFRDDINPLVAKFLGDVFVYLKDGAIRAKIRTEVANALMKAHQAKSPGEPVIVMGHSMGGVILTDMLSDPAAGEIAGFEADLLITVGSQPGFFEEHKLFAMSDPSIGKDGVVKRAKKPAKAKAWWNVYDPVDVLAFRCEGIFDEADVKDFAFSSAVGLLDAHTAYFKRPKFYERLHDRVTEFLT